MTPRTISYVMMVALRAGLGARTTGRGRMEAEACRVNGRISALQNEADDLAVQAHTPLGDLRKLEIDRELQVERVRQAEAAAAQSQAAIVNTFERLASLEEERAAQPPCLRTQLVDIYKQGRAGYLIDHGADAYSLYGHLGAVSVARGDTVDSGTEIARVGAPPLGPAALYLNIRIDGRSVDPVEWLEPR